MPRQIHQEKNSVHLAPGAWFLELDFAVLQSVPVVPVGEGENVGEGPMPGSIIRSLQYHYIYDDTRRPVLVPLRLGGYK
eukprot:3084008-Rhodomonas_salina.1